MTWQLKLFGNLRAERGTEKVEKFRTQKTAALLALLALRGSQERESICALLWPDAPPEAARNSLSAALSALRKDLGNDVVLADRQTVSLAPNAITTDVSLFDFTLKGGDFAAAAALYEGHLLPSVHEEPFPAIAGEYREKAHAAFRSYLEILEQNREVETLRSVARRAIAIFSDDERWFLSLMRAHAFNQDWDAALRTYEALQRFARKNGDLVSETARALAKGIRRKKEEIQNQEASSPAPLQVNIEVSPPSKSTGFPPQWTRFFGREAEKDLLRHWLVNGQKLITLTGAGGSGKTRLAIETLRDAEEVWETLYFVPLAPLADPSLLHATIRDALGLRVAPDLPPLEQLERTLRGQKIAFLLDNFEQLVEGGTAELQALREKLPDATFVVTSRILLNLPGEREFPVSPLPTPMQRTSLPAVRDCPSAALFCDRAATQIDLENAESIGALCRRLDGIPLAIELAAARAKMLAPMQILERLERHPDFLQSRELGVPPRHKTLRATIEWSVDLLPQELKQFFCRLCVFRGGFSLEAAEQVAAPGICPEWETIDFLEQLRSHSLLQTIDTPTGTRYRLLEMLREWAEGELSVSEAAELRARHCQYFLAQAENSRNFTVLLRQQAEMEADIANYRAALSFSQENDPLQSIQFASALCGFWEVRSHFSEGCSWVRHALTLSEGLPAEVRAPLMRGAGSLFWYGGDLKQARDVLEVSVKLYETLDDEAGLAHALDMFGKSQMVRAECEQGRQNGERAVAIARSRGDIARLTSALITQAWGLTNTFRPLESNVLLDEALAIAKSIGEPRLIAICQGSQSLNYWGDGQADVALARCHSLLDAYDEKAGPYARGFALGVVTLIGCGLDAWDMVRPLLPEVTREHFSIGTRWEFINLFYVAGRFAFRQENFALAAQFYSAAEAKCQSSGYCLVPCLFELDLTPDEAAELKARPEGQAGWARGKNTSDEEVVALVEKMCA